MAFYDKSNKELAAELGISNQRLSNYLSGLNRPPLDILQKISEKFHISMDFLINDKFELHIIYRNKEIHELPAVAEARSYYETLNFSEWENLFNKLEASKKKLIIELIKKLVEE